MEFSCVSSVGPLPCGCAQTISKQPSYDLVEKIWSWPKVAGRKVDGGKDDGLVTESLPLSSSPSFIMRKDGPVVYESTSEFNIEIAGKGYRIPPSLAVQLDCCVAHSLPMGEGEVKRSARPTNGVISVASSTETSSCCGGCKKEVVILPPSFSASCLQLTEAQAGEGYEIVGTGFDKATAVNWPTAPGSVSYVPALQQTFTMEWVDEGDRKEILFKGLTGSLKGGEGRPGVVYNKADNTISVNLLLSRPDGTFGISTDDVLCMLIAQPDAAGNPDVASLRALTFKNGACLPAHWWHSVPFPPVNVDKIHLHECVAASNANVAINVADECGAPIKVQL